MTKAEAEIFENMPLFKLFLKMRAWDDRAKEVEFSYPNLEKYKEMAWQHLGYRLH
jgi:hypothetical protein